MTGTPDLDKNIPLPVRGQYNGVKVTPDVDWPSWAVDDSWFFPAPVQVKSSQWLLQKRLSATASLWCKKNAPERKFTTSQVVEHDTMGVRVWRKL